ncbi:MAG: hypothetical protein WA162_05290 [Thermodesulfobacteriota bacterium]
MQKIFEDKRFHLWMSGLLILAVFLVYSNTFKASFHFDDTPNIVENYKIRSLGNLPEILKGQRGFTMATFALNYAVGGLNVIGYHVVNISIHAVAAVLAYFFVFLTLGSLTEDETWAKRIAAYSALLFAVHPVQTQSVTYIVQRMESLSSLFYLAALLFFIKSARCSDSGKRIALYAGVAIAYVLGFMSKEIAITLPAIALLYDYYFIAKGEVKGIFARVPVYAILAILSVIFIVVFIAPMGGFGDLSEESSGLAGSAPSAGFGVKSITPLEYLFTQFNVIVYYIALLLAPINQNLDYDFPVSRGLFEMPVVKEGTILNIPILPPIVSLVILLAIVAVAVWLFLRYKKTGDARALVISFFVFWFFIILAPTSSFVPIIDVIFEHRLYLASLGFFVVFAVCFDWFFDWLGSRRAASAAKQ